MIEHLWKIKKLFKKMQNSKDREQLKLNTWLLHDYIRKNLTEDSE